MKIHWISPYSPFSPPNIGGAINQAITDLAAEREDWICHTDHDVLWLLPDSKRQVMEILSETGYDVLGCMTNRLAAPYQLVPGMFEQDSISKHVNLAKGIYACYGREVTNMRPHPVAAMMMCFKVGTWVDLGGFTEGTIDFDKDFCRKTYASGRAVGLMTGIYVYHMYRHNSLNPRSDISHLIS